MAMFLKSKIHLEEQQVSTSVPFYSVVVCEGNDSQSFLPLINNGYMMPVSYGLVKISSYRSEIVQHEILVVCCAN